MAIVDVSVSGRGIFLTFLTKEYQVVERVCFELIQWNEPIGALIHLGLDHGYAVAGDTAKAKTAYQGLLGAVERRGPRRVHPETS